jgi:hypothetical protein
VRVRLRVVVPSRRYFVALDDPLPAGLEAVDLKLRTSAFSALAGQAGRRPSTAGRLYRRFPASHREKRDDRVVLLADRLPAGVYEYTYLARATTVGTFVVPPLEASEMYHPEVFGRSGTAIVQVRESAEAKAKAKESAEAKAKAKESDEAKAKAKESDEAKGSGGPAQP